VYQRIETKKNRILIWEVGWMTKGDQELDPKESDKISIYLSTGGEEAVIKYQRQMGKTQHLFLVGEELTRMKRSYAPQQALSGGQTLPGGQGNGQAPSSLT